MTGFKKFEKLRKEYRSKHRDAQDPANYLMMGVEKLSSIMEGAKGRKIIFTLIKGTNGGVHVEYV